jgi:hypothetical protein
MHWSKIPFNLQKKLQIGKRNKSPNKKGIDQVSGQSCTLVSMCARNSNLESYLVSRYECCAPEVVIENSKYVFGLLLTLSHI